MMKFIAKEINHDSMWNIPDYQSRPVYLPFTRFVLWYKEPLLPRNYDSGNRLASLGFKVKSLNPSSTHYQCILPEGWTTKSSGYWTDFYDAAGVKKISQFDKYAYYDRCHKVTFL